MSNTKKMLEYLRSEGLQPTEESFGITFRYQMKNFVYFILYGSSATARDEP